jgi:hypothetical protein
MILEVPPAALRGDSETHARHRSRLVARELLPVALEASPGMDPEEPAALPSALLLKECDGCGHFIHCASHLLSKEAPRNMPYVIARCNRSCGPCIVSRASLRAGSAAPWYVNLGVEL